MENDNSNPSFDKYQKYKKYKIKYLKLKSSIGGAKFTEPEIIYGMDEHGYKSELDGLAITSAEDLISYQKLINQLEILKLPDSNQNEMIKRIATNNEYGWDIIKIDTSDVKTKCKHFDMDTPNLLLLFSNKQKRTSKIFTKLSDDRERMDNPIKYYTFLISDRGIKFGSINDGLEYGTAHLHLVDDENEEVIIAGEVKVSGTDLFYNFASGTVSLEQAKKNQQKFDINLMKARKLCEAIFTFQLPETKRIIYRGDNVNGSLFKFDNPYPSAEEFEEICADPNVQLYRSTYVNNKDKMCTNNSITTLGDLTVKSAYTNLGKQLSQLNSRNTLNIKVPDNEHFTNYCKK